ncbi:hypothetical protein [Streptomyces sp. B22F1]
MTRTVLPLAQAHDLRGTDPTPFGHGGGQLTWQGYGSTMTDNG